MLSYLKSSTLLLSILLVGCASPVEFQSKHDHDTVVKFASRHTDNKRQGTAWAKVLESSFAQANEIDLRKIEELKALNTAEAWERIHAINERIEKRQARVEPLLPIVTEDGYRPDLRLLPVEEMLAESRKEVVAHRLTEIEGNLQLGREGDKLAARKAHGRIVSLRDKYGWNEPLATELQNEALALGRVYVLLDMQTRWFFDGNRVINQIDFWGVNGNRWQVIHTSEQPGVHYDYRAELDILSASVSPDVLNTTSNTVTEKVQVGQKAVKDTNGVVTYKPIFKEVRATIYQVNASKNANVTAEMNIYDANGRRLRSDMIFASDNFSENFSYYTGDARVSATNGCRSSNTVFFPTEWAMLDNCASDLRFRLNCLIDEADVQ
ncbi:MAG: hypothetical protein IT258_07035 [Saprospiraceae bacterium]|nr:hypothetical protein [Saprospiraceae bacterium]